MLSFLLQCFWELGLFFPSFFFFFPLSPGIKSKFPHFIMDMLQLAVSKSASANQWLLLISMEKSYKFHPDMASVV